MLRLSALEAVAAELRPRASRGLGDAIPKFVRPMSYVHQPHFDFKALKDKADYANANITRRKSKGDVTTVISLYDQQVEMQKKVDLLRAERNRIAQDSSVSIAEKQASGKRVKESLAELEGSLSELKQHLVKHAQALPCDSHPDAPVGPEANARTIMAVGNKPQFSFQPRDHVTLGKALGLFDLEAAATITGSAFSVLTGKGALLELALVQFAMSRAAAAGFLPVLPPDLAHVSLVEGCGFNPRDEAENGGLCQVYRLAGSDLCLIGTAEIPLAGLHAGQILPLADMPKAYAAFSHCFRREAGGAGSATRGLYRLHQFSKVELFAFLAPSVPVPPSSPLHVTRVTHRQLLDALLHKGSTSAAGEAAGPTPPALVSDSALAALVDFQVGMIETLGLHARVLDMPTEELGASAYRKVDCEAWMPGRATAGSKNVGSYGEVSSASNCMTYQAQRLNMRVKAEGGNHFVHTLNATALAVPRIILSLLETHQQADGCVVLPDALVPFMGGTKVLTPVHPAALSETSQDKRAGKGK